MEGGGVSDPLVGNIEVQIPRRTYVQSLIIAEEQSLLSFTSENFDIHMYSNVG